MSKQFTFGRAVKWAYVMSWGDKGLNALMMFVLASLLGPREFGIIAMALVYIEFIQMFLDQGLVAVIIQRKELAAKHCDSVFWMITSLSIVLAAASIACSRWWAAVNHVPELALVLCVLSVAIPIEALSIVPKAVLQRDMDFKSLSLRSNISVLIGGLVGIGMALAGFKVWALVAQSLARDVAAVALLWKLSHWRPSFQFSLSHLRDLLGFSVPNFTAKLGVFASGQFDTVLLGLFFSPVAVGLVRLADRIVTMALEVSARSIQVVSFPQFSRVQDQHDELKRSVVSCLRMSSIVTIPILAGIALTSDLLVAAVGPKWADSAGALKILAVVGMPLVFAQFTGPLLQALGRPRRLAIITWALAAVSVTTLCVVGILFRNGPVHTQTMGFAIARTISSGLIFAPIMLFILAKLSGISLKEFIGAVAPSFMAAAAMTLALLPLSLGTLLQGWKPIPALFLHVFIGLLAASATLLWLDNPLRTRVLSSIRAPLRGKYVETELT